MPNANFKSKPHGKPIKGKQPHKIDVEFDNPNVEEGDVKGRVICVVASEQEKAALRADYAKNFTVTDGVLE